MGSPSHDRATLPTSVYGPHGSASQSHVRIDSPRCQNGTCGRRLAEYLTTPYSIRCPKCGQQAVST